jgi:5-methylcytosine-specific restriction endonuclease McrA
MPRQREFVGNNCETCGGLIQPKGTSVAQQRKARFCSMTCRRAASTRKDSNCEHCGEAFSVSAAHAQQRFCSVACRSAAGRKDIICEHCGKTVNFKANKAKVQRFCNRTCMFAALGCAVCSKIRPIERQATGDKYCSSRCEMTAHLEQQGELTGQLLVVCSRCTRILPAGCFTRDRKNRNGLSYKCQDCARGYYEMNKDAYRLRRYGYQAAFGGVVVDFTATQKAERFALWGGRCWMCGIETASEEDHVKPISKGGSHCLSNLRPICKSCNASKGGRWPLRAGELQANFRHPNPRSGSDETTARRPRVEWTCPQCNTTSLIRAHSADTRKYCSKACAFEARRARVLVKTCLNPLCGRAFELPDRKGSVVRKFCSIECAWIARDRPAHWGRIADGQLNLF